jgi:DNA-directed RNA polymerase specialized sigma24 family protein
MNDSQDFATLLALSQTGDEVAASRLVREYEPELRRYVRFRLTHPGLRRFVDSLDICQSVLASFFVHLQEGRLDLVEPRQLARLLAVMADNKVRDKVRQHRSVRRGRGAPVAGGVETIDLPSPAPEPAEVVAGQEIAAAIRGKLPADERPLVEMWLAGGGWQELAAAANTTPEAVRKRVNRSIDAAARELGLIEETV